MAVDWRTEPDVAALRESVTSSIVATFQRRRPDASANTRELPNFVKRLEEQLFRMAATKEEYGDLATLEARLQSVARRLSQNARNAVGSGSGGGGARPLNGTTPADAQQQQQPDAGMVPPQQPQPFIGDGAGGMPQQQQQPVDNGMIKPDPGLDSNGIKRKALPAGMAAAPAGVVPAGGMVPMDAVGGGSAYGAMAPQQQPGGIGMMPAPGGMMPVPGGALVPQQQQQPPGLMMANGAPVLRKDQWGGGAGTGGGMMPAPGGANGPLLGGMSAPMGAMGGPFGMAPMGAPGGMVPMGGPPGMVPVGGGMVPSHGVGAPPPGMVPMGGGAGMPPGMVGLNGMVAQMPPGMMPPPGGAVPPGMMGAPPGAAGFPGGIMLGPGGGGGVVDPTAAAAAGGAVPGQPLTPQQQQQQQQGSASTAQQQSSAAATSQQQQQQQMQGRTQYIQKQQRWLLFLRHCAKCQQSEQECQFSRSCRVGKELWQHILACTNTKCTYPRCVSSKDLLKHHQKCQNAACPICTPVKEYVRRSRNPGGAAAAPAGVGGAPGPGGPGGFDPTAAAAAAMYAPPPGGGFGMPGAGPPGMAAMAAAQQQQFAAQQQQFMAQQQFAMQQQQLYIAQQQQQQQRQALVGQKRPLNGLDPTGAGAMMMPNAMGAYGATPQLAPPPVLEEPKPKRSRADEAALLAKNTGTSLLETFDADTLRLHVDRVREEVARGQARNGGAAAAAAAAYADPKDTCTVCRQSKFTFEPPCLYCTQCGQRIRRGQTYHCTPPEYEIKGFWCHGCFSEHKGDRVPFDGSQTGFVRKAEVAKRKNDEEIEEYWVQCDCCEAWVHQICGLFNKGRNNAASTYLCPDCLQRGFSEGLRARIETRPQSMLEAADLPHCALSRAMTARLERALAEDRARRAAQLNLPLEQVPAAEGLTVRVINNVSKKCEVRPKFLEAFGGGRNGVTPPYPEAFPYRQRVVLLYQRTDGVDVALFCMYVQEYGADCPPPNRNVVYLSYLDSVKYFRPEAQAAAASGGGSLRTFVYHQILLAYVEWVRNLGYERMLIWACPPLQGDDYILYCHPSKQKVPRSDRLRAWYHDMLRAARAEGTIVGVSTLFDAYFEGGRDHRADRCSATLLPYLEGDFWPGEAENLLAALAADGGFGGGSGKGGGAGRKGGGGPKGKQRYAADGPGGADGALMAKLGDILGGNMREDFMVVHMREPCSLCRSAVLSGTLYRYTPPPGAAPSAASGRSGGASGRSFEGIQLGGGAGGGGGGGGAQVSNFQACAACFSAEMGRLSAGARPRLPDRVALSDLVATTVEEVPVLRDPDPDIESEIFETRQAFLSLCQGNHYQFDSLRRAKHSSMMVLYHLHNPNAPAWASTCNRCGLEIEAGTGWRCSVCPDYDMCGACRAAGHQHEHPMVAHNSNLGRIDETRTRLTEQERAERAAQLQRTLQLLVHACSCNNPQCGSSSCRKVRQLFQHAVQCQLKVTGGCQLCKKMWCLLNLHAKSCTAAECPVPRCRELRDLRRRQALRQDKARRAAYQQMLRAQAGGGYGGGGGGE